MSDTRVNTDVESSRSPMRSAHGRAADRQYREFGSISGRRQRPILRRFWRSKRGVAALEFALVAPFLITLLLGGFEITRYIKTVRHINFVSSTIGQFFSQNTTGTITDDDMHFAIDSTMIIFPDSLANAARKGLYWWQDISLAMSSVAFTPTVPGCASNCTYNATLMWTSFAGTSRPCSTPLLPVSDTATPSPTTLPADVYGPGTLIVIDVVYNYTPMVATQLFGTMKITRSFYVQPRYVSTIAYTHTANAMGVKCPGY